MAYFWYAYCSSGGMILRRKDNITNLVKWLLKISVVGSVVAGATGAMAGQAARTGIMGSFHDISSLGVAFGGYAQDDFQRSCIFCHTPHNAELQGGVAMPLWNRGGNSVSTVNLAPYTWSAPANLPISFDADPLVGPSRMCMSCHDGITAVDTHGPDSGSARGEIDNLDVMSSPGRYIDNLANTHPIGFRYEDAINSRGTGELINPNEFFVDSVPSGAAAATTNTNARQASGFTYTTKRISDTLYSGFVTCASCHEVHNTNNAVNEPSLSNPNYRPNYFIWAKEQNSALCLSCHIK